MNEREVQSLIVSEVESIRKRDGTLPGTPYLWAEIRARQKNLKPWEGMAASQTVGRALRTLLESVLNPSPKSPQPQAEVEPSPGYLPPLEAVKEAGAKKHRHLPRNSHDTNARAS